MAIKRKNKNTPSSITATIGDAMNFASSEAYKLLRTNLNFSLPDEKNCKVIGITSAVRNEGKTTTSLNLAYTLAQTGQNVLIIDGDMRLPKVHVTLNVKSGPGLSNMLAGLTESKIPLQKSGMLDSLYVISAGDIPPNPSELLGAKSAKIALDTLRENFDYIIIDLPPVDIVSDALVISPLCDGMLIVVRQDYSKREDVAAAVEQLRYSGANILGFVTTHTNIAKKNYRRYGRYYRRYGYRNYGYGYGYDGYGYNDYGYGGYGGYGYGYGYGGYGGRKRREKVQPVKEDFGVDMPQGEENDDAE